MKQYNLAELTDVEFIFISDRETIEAFRSSFSDGMTLQDASLSTNAARAYMDPGTWAAVSAIAASGTLLLKVVEFIFDKLDKKKAKKVILHTATDTHTFEQDCTIEHITKVVYEMSK